MPGDAWPWMNTMSPGWFSDCARQKWLKPTSYSVADDAYVERWPPYSLDTLFALSTIASAFQRMHASMRFSISRLPGYDGSWPGEIVLTYAVFGRNGR